MTTGVAYDDACPTRAFVPIRVPVRRQLRSREGFCPRVRSELALESTFPNQTAPPAK